MWPSTAFTRMTEIELPIVLGPMAGGPSTPALAAAVSNAGGLGSLGVGYLSPEEVRAAIREVRALTGRPFAVNLLIPAATPATSAAGATAAAIERAQERLDPLRRELGILDIERRAPARYDLPFEEQMAAVVAEGVPVFSFTFGVLPPAWVRRLRAQGTVLVGTATSVREAVALVASGADAVSAQGSEAGGHRGSFLGPGRGALVGTMALVPAVADAVEVPVLAAGGIMDARGIVAALALGAAGAQLGTAFLASPESGAHPLHKAAVRAATEESTTVTRGVTGRPVRALRNRLVDALLDGEESAPEYPVQHVLSSDVRRAAAAADRADLMGMWAGQGTRLATGRPAGELVRDLAAGVEALLRRLGRCGVR